MSQRTSIPNPDMSHYYMPAKNVRVYENGKKNRLSVEVTSHKHGTYRFTVKDRSIKIEALADKASSTPWMNAFFQKNKDRFLPNENFLNAMNYLLAEHRLCTLGDSGFKVSAIGLTESGELFIAANAQTVHSFYKACAETNMLHAAQETEIKRARAEQTTDQKKANTKPKITALFLMGGNESRSIDAVCPCGMCTDSLKQAMPENAPVYVFQIPKSNQEEQEDRPSQPVQLQSVSIDHNASSLSEVKDRHNVWLTTINHLHGTNRYTNLSTELKALQREALVSLTDRIQVTPETQAESDKLTILARIHKNSKKPTDPISWVNLIMHPGDLVSRAGDSLTRMQRKAKEAIQSIENTLSGRDSVAALEIDSTFDSGGMPIPNPQTLNEFMVHEIDHALARRVQGQNLNILSDDDYSVRCAVLQLTDGTFHYGVECKTSVDNSMPSAEVGALMNSVSSIGRHKVAKAWVMELDPKDIRRGVCETPSKDAIERLNKRSQNLQLSVIPYNDGSPEATKQIGHKFSTFLNLKKLFPSMFTGRAQ